MTVYKELQEQAKKLGIKHVGVSAAALEKAIKVAESAPAVDKSPNKPKENEDINAAIVYDGKREVRRYTVELHGEDFENNAEGFSKKNGYTIELKNVKPSLKCPNCGQEIYP